MHAADRRPVARAAVVALSVLLASACAPEDPAPREGSTQAAAVTTLARSLQIVWSRRLPFSDASGLGVRHGAAGVEVLGVGDASTTLASFALPRPGTTPMIASHEIGGLLGGQGHQLEAVASDGEGRVFLLTESKATITVLAPDLGRSSHILRLRFPDGHPLAERWAADDNSRGEGMVLLRNGHVLAAKEKKPPALVEFAPRGGVAEGYRVDLATTRAAFPLPSPGIVDLFAVAYWTLSAEDERSFGDISELAVDDAGNLLFASDQGRALARVGGVLDPGRRHVPIEARWALPSVIKKPEGLAIVNQRIFVASDDGDQGRAALFELAP